MGKLNYSRLGTKDISPAVDCVMRVFLYDEPMTKVLGISESEFRVFAEGVCKKAAKERISYVCRNNLGKIVGFCLSEDLVSETFLNLEKITPKMNPIFIILGKLDSEYLKDKKCAKGRYFHLFMAGTLSDYRNRGIVREFIARSLNLARRKKFKKAVSEATSIKSQKLLENHFKFKTIKKINYKTFRFNNKFLFKNIGEASCNLMELNLE